LRNFLVLVRNYGNVLAISFWVLDFGSYIWILAVWNLDIPFRYWVVIPLSFYDTFTYPFLVYEPIFWLDHTTLFHFVHVLFHVLFHVHFVCCSLSVCLFDLYMVDDFIMFFIDYMFSLWIDGAYHSFYLGYWHTSSIMPSD